MSASSRRRAVDDPLPEPAFPPRRAPGAWPAAVVLGLVTAWPAPADGGGSDVLQAGLDSLLAGRTGGTAWLAGAVTAGLAVVTLVTLAVRVHLRSSAPAGEPAGLAPEAPGAQPGEPQPPGPPSAAPSASADPAPDDSALDLLIASLRRSPAAPARAADVIKAMFATSHGRDHETLAHSCRVARFAVALAERIGIRGETLTALELGALLHDVGKAALPGHLLRKAGPLSEDEMAVVREHPRHGYQMLKHLVFLGPALDVVLSHHERWDGSGYPNGISAEEIPLAARIFAVVDTYDAITSDRPYRSARGHARAAGELRRVAGAQLDPRVVDRFLEIPESDLERLRRLTRVKTVRLAGAGDAGTAAGSVRQD